MDGVIYRVVYHILNGELAIFSFRYRFDQEIALPRVFTEGDHVCYYVQTWTQTGTTSGPEICTIIKADQLILDI